MSEFMCKQCGALGERECVEFHPHLPGAIQSLLNWHGQGVIIWARLERLEKREGWERFQLTFDVSQRAT